MMSAVVPLLVRFALGSLPGAPADEFGPTRDAFVEKINAARGERGLKSLRLDGLLSRVAQQRAEAIARTGKAEPEKSAQ